MTVERHQVEEENVGAYLLGALTDPEVRSFEEHVAECPICRDELERLRPAVDALPRSVPALAPPPGLKASIMAAVQAEAREQAAPVPDGPATTAEGVPTSEPVVPSRRDTRARRWLGGLRPSFAWAGTAVVLAAAALTGYAVTELTSDGGDRSRLLRAKADKGRLPFASGSLVVPGEGEKGAILRVQGMPALEDGAVYQVWLKRGDEVISQALFSVTGDGAGTAAVPEDLGGAEAVLVTRERAGGAKAPTEEPVLSVSL